MRSKPVQSSLFELSGPEVEAADVDDAQREVAARLSSSVRFGTMSWSFAGWRGLVYGSRVNVKRLTEAGLEAYAQHPLLGAVEIDRSYYEPLSSELYRHYAAQVPPQFRFQVKAHEDCVVRRFPSHARYGKKRDQDNPRYLDAQYATEAVIGPIAAGLGPKLGTILFAFPPHEESSPSSFYRRLHAFLSRLPPGITYAVELRNRALFTPAYAAVLAETGAVHCHNVWGDMPSVLAQAKLVPPAARRPLVIRWLLRRGDEYEAARARYAPFDRLVEEDLESRNAIARLVAKAALHDVPTLVLVNNKVEGCAPASIFQLAQAIVRETNSDARAAGDA